MEEPTATHLLDDHSELALPAEDRFDPRQPLYVREDFGRADEDLAWVETIRFMKEQALGRRAQAPPGLQHTTARIAFHQSFLHYSSKSTAILLLNTKSSVAAFQSF